MTASVQATGDVLSGRGNQGPIPTAIEWEAEQVSIGPATPFHWNFRAHPLR